MRIRYSSHQLRKECSDEREMKRKRGSVAPKLRLRINALSAATSLEDLQTLDPLGRWHPLTANRSGQWAGDLSRNWRLIVEDDGVEGGEVSVLVIEIEDYH